MSANRPPDDLIGKTLGQFEILEEIGRGGMATVYSARQTSMNRTVAIKVLPRHLMHDPNFYERFEREVDVIAHLEHPHILPIYDYGQTDGIPFIAMRFLGGGSMEQMIRRSAGKGKPEDLERPIRQICQALDYAHKEGIIHRDIKPGNIMLDTGDNAYLSDFGIARVLGSELTGSMIVGTPAYMSPEQANGISIDGRADIYAMGVVLFELLTGREPYQAETPMAVLLKHINEPMPPITQFRSDISPEVDKVIQKATAKDPNDRFSSAGDMAKAFSSALRGETAVFDAPTRTVSPKNEVDTRSMDNTKTITDQMMPNHPTIPPTQNPMTPVPGSITGSFTDSGTNLTGIGASTQTQFPTRSGPSTGLLVAIVLIVAVVVIGGVAALSITSDKGNDPTTTVNTPVANLVPTPFFRAETVRGDIYTVSIPEAWIPPVGRYDLSTTNRLIHVWQPDNVNAYVALEIEELNLSDTEAFQSAIDRYVEEELASRDGTFTEIDSSVAPDGTVRKSYRMVDASNGSTDFEPGQLDIFFENRAPYFIAVNMYSADSTGNTLVQTFQSILDSLRIEEDGSA